MKSTWSYRITHTLIVLTVFALTGFSVAKIAGMIVDHFEITRFSLKYWLVWTVILLPLYQVFLMLFALLFCKYSYFRDKQKKMIMKILSVFRRKAK